MVTKLAAVAAVLAALNAWTYARPLPPQAAAPQLAALIPLAFGEWIGGDAPPLDSEVMRVLAADEYVHRYYGSRTDPSRVAGDARALVEMDVAYYARPEAGAAMHSPLSCLPGNGWQIVESGTMPLDDGRSVRRLVAGRGEHRVAMTYWFQNRGAIVATESRQRLQLLANGLQGRATDAALVRVMARDTDSGRAALTRFTRELAHRLGVVFD